MAPATTSAVVPSESEPAAAGAPRQRRPSTSAPVIDLQGPVGPGFSRPKHKRTVTGFGPSDIKTVEASIPPELRETWKKYSAKPFSTKDEFEKSAIGHIETTLARSLYNCDEL
jgi:starch phosphorylase